MNNLKLYENTILVKADKKTQDYLTEWGVQKKEEYLNRQKKLGIEVDVNELEDRELRGEVLPYEKQLIPQYEEIRLEFHEALEDHGAGIYNANGPNKASSGSKSARVEIEDVSRSTANEKSD